MKESLINFNKQADFKVDNFKLHTKTTPKYFILCGMGGSQLGAKILQSQYNNIFIHNDYGPINLPESIIKDSLVVFCSHSGNTQEVLDSFQKVIITHNNLAVITTGGELEKVALRHNVPLLPIPKTKDEPRMTIGFQLIALTQVFNLNNDQLEIKKALENLNTKSISDQGTALSLLLANKNILVYTSHRNSGLGYYWKITLNETGKNPAFLSILPEANHNEIESIENQSEYNLISLFLNDTDDVFPVKKRFKATKDIYEKFIETKSLSMVGSSYWEKTINSIHLAQWTAFYMATNKHVNPAQTSRIADLKEVI